jgi:hypothetical protein
MLVHENPNEMYLDLLEQVYSLGLEFGILGVN